MKRAVTPVVSAFVLFAAAARAQASQPGEPLPAPQTSAPSAPTFTPSKDFPKGTATPSAECGACHQAIYREYAEGFGSDMRYFGVTLRAKGDKVLTMPASTSVSASAHSVSGTDPWPVHAREAEEQGKKCNVCHFPQPFAIPERTTIDVPARAVAYDLNRYNDRSFKGDQREISRLTLPLQVKTSR